MAEAKLPHLQIQGISKSAIRQVLERSAARYEAWVTLGEEIRGQILRGVGMITLTPSMSEAFALHDYWRRDHSCCNFSDDYDESLDDRIYDTVGNLNHRDSMKLSQPPHCPSGSEGTSDLWRFARAMRGNGWTITDSDGDLIHRDDPACPTPDMFEDGPVPKAQFEYFLKSVDQVVWFRAMLQANVE